MALKVGDKVTLYDKSYTVGKELVYNEEMYFLCVLSDMYDRYGFVNDGGYCYTRFYSLLELEEAVNNEIEEEKEENYKHHPADEFVLKGVTCRIEDDGESFYVVNVKDNNRLIFETDNGLETKFASLSELESVIYMELKNDSMKKEESHEFNIGEYFYYKGSLCYIDTDLYFFYLVNSDDNRKMVLVTDNGYNVDFNSLDDIKSVIYKNLKSNSMEKEESQFQGITDSISELLRVKNQRYGACYKDRLKIFDGKCANGQRLDEKLSRIKNSEELRLNDLADIIGFLVITIDELGYKGDDILNLID